MEEETRKVVVERIQVKGEQNFSRESALFSLLKSFTKSVCVTERLKD